MKATGEAHRADDFAAADGLGHQPTPGGQNVEPRGLRRIQPLLEALDDAHRLLPRPALCRIDLPRLACQALHLSQQGFVLCEHLVYRPAGRCGEVPPAAWEARRGPPGRPAGLPAGRPASRLAARRLVHSRRRRRHSRSYRRWPGQHRRWGGRAERSGGRSAVGSLEGGLQRGLERRLPCRRERRVLSRGRFSLSEGSGLVVDGAAERLDEQLLRLVVGAAGRRGGLVGAMRPMVGG